jgi:two-component system, NarL family, response regulator NreC
MMPYRIVLADDHVILRHGLRKLLEAGAELEVIGEADDGLELVRLLKGLAPDLIVLDISMPHLRGIEAIHEIRVIDPKVKVLILTMHSEIDLVHAAMSAGANGYVLKEDAETDLFAAIGKIRQGGTYVSARLSDDLTHDWARKHRTPGVRAAEVDRLTIREKEVLKLTAEGKSSKEMADLFCISVRTVEHHRAHIMTKLNVRRTAEVVRYALAEGYL